METSGVRRTDDSREQQDKGFDARRELSMLVIAAQKKVSFLVSGGDGTEEVEAIMVSFVFAIIFAHWFSLVLASM
jgi:hypothetical protein